MSGRGDDEAALRREVMALRAQVAELRRARAQSNDADSVSLNEREELLGEVERVAHLGTWTWDLQSGHVTWSDELYRILGLDPGKVTPAVETFFAAVHPADRARAQMASEQGLAEGVLSPVDCRVVRPDGTIRHTTCSAVYLFDTQRKPRRAVGGVLDRTSSLEAEGKLRRALALLEEAQHSAQLGTWRYVPSTGELEWSREFRRIAGIPDSIPPSAELFLTRVTLEERARFREGYERMLACPEGAEIHGQLARPDGQVRHVRLSGALQAGPDGVDELRGTMLDVSDQMRMREELAHAQKMEAVGRLAGGIAHDFNNLLTVITGNLELLSDRIQGAPELDDSLRALSSASGLTKRLLAFGRKAQLTLKLVPPNELVRSTMALMSRLVGDEVRLETELASNLPFVKVDALEIERSLVNLVVNARDAMPYGGVVRIATRERKVYGERFVELAVTDEGPGISEADLPHIFEPFYTTRRDSGGTGLGLATVLGTAEQHGGTVRAESLREGGSRFTIMLPAAAPAREYASGTMTVSRPQTTERKLSVMIVDDEPMVAEVTKRMLGARGHEVRLARGADEARAIWRAHRGEIDLVLCDVVMAELRGPELIAQLAEEGPAPRVLFMTGYSDEATRAQLGHTVLGKPFSAAALFSAIDEALVRELTPLRNAAARER